MFQKGEITFGRDPKKIAFALSAAQSPDAVKPLAKLLSGGTMPKDKEHELYLVLAKIGGAEEAATVLKRAANTSLAPREQIALISEVEQSARSRKVGATERCDLLGYTIESPASPRLPGRR